MAKPRLIALRKAVKKVIDAKGKAARTEALIDFDILNNQGWQTCAVGSFLNDCGIDVTQMATCRGTSRGSVVRSLIDPDIVEQGSDFETYVYSSKKSGRTKALKLLDKLIRARPCTIMKI